MGKTKEYKTPKKDGPDGDYLVVDKDGQHLRVKKNGKPDHGLMGDAWAALHEGFRGNTYEGSGKAGAIAKLKKLYASEKMDLPGSGKSVKDDGDSLEEQTRDAREAFAEQFNPDMAPMQMDMGPCVTETYAEYVIVCDGDENFKVPYTVDADENYVFAPRDQWQSVEQEWVPAPEEGPSAASLDFSDDVAVYYGEAVKAVKLDDGSVKLGGYLVRYGDPKTPDLTGDFFTKNTDLGDAVEADGWFNHRVPVIAEGVAVEYKSRLPKVTLVKDDVGVFAETVIKARNEYEKAIADMGLAGKLGWSSGTASHLVERKAVGNAWEITSWPLGLDASLTPKPAEFRNQVIPLKSLLSENNSFSAGKAEVTGSVTPSGGEHKPPRLLTGQSSQGEFDMDEKDLLRILDERDARKAAADKAAAEAKAAHDAEIKAAEEAAYKKAADEFKSQRRGFYAANVNTVGLGNSNDETKSFLHWMLTGDDVPLKQDMSDGTKALTAELRGWYREKDPKYKAALAGQSDSAGGYAIPDDFYDQIVAKRTELSVIDRMGTLRIPTTLDRILVPTEGTAVTKFVVVPEGSAYDENEPTLGQVPITIWKMTKMIKLSEELEADARGNFANYMAGLWARGMAQADNYYLVNGGTGTGQPQAFAAGATDCGTTPASATAVTAAELLALIYSMPAQYSDNMAIIMRRATLGTIRALTGNFFSFLPTPTINAGGQLGGGNAGPNGRGRGPDGYIHDVPVYCTTVMPAMASLAKSFLLVNPEFYAVAEREGLLVQRNPWRYMDTGQIGLFAKYRQGGAVLQAEAIYSMSMHS